MSSIRWRVRRIWCKCRCLKGLLTSHPGVLGWPGEGVVVLARDIGACWSGMLPLLFVSRVPRRPMRCCP
jgi:hypothetical protein